MLGKRFGPKMKQVSALINEWGNEEIRTIERQGTYELKLDEGTVTISLEEVLISSRDIPGWAVASDNGVTVALDITITGELKQEGIARDFVNRIQNMRKEMGLEVQDKIRIEVAMFDEEVDLAIQNFADYIQTETQALSLSLQKEINGGTVLDMDNFDLIVKVEKV